MNIHKTLKIVFLIVALSLSQSSIAKISMGSLLFGDFNNESAEERNLIADDLLYEVQRLYDYLPTQKLHEIEWVNKEIDALSRLSGDAWNSRANKVMSSPELAHKRFNTSLESLIGALECVSFQSEIRFVVEDHNIQREVMCWSVVSYIMSDKEIFEDWLGELIKSGRLPKEALNGRDDAHSLYFSYNWHARGILQHIVIPFLKFEIH